MEIGERDSLRGATAWALLAGAAASAAALFWGVKAAGGVAAGAAMGAAGLYLLRQIVPRAFATRRPRFWLSAVWVFKFPLLCTVLYYLIGMGVVDPIGFSVGTGVVPAALVIVGLRPEKRRG